MNKNKYNVGDTVIVGSPVWNRRWHGCKATITEILGSGRYAATVDGPRASSSGLNTGFFDETEISHKMEILTLDDLRRVVDSLRDQGYFVDVKVTPPTETITL